MLNVKRGMYTLLAIVAVTILAACAGSQWSREGTNPETMKEDSTACAATAKIRGRTEFPEILVYSSMEFGGRSNLEDINLKNFTRVRIEYERDCMLEMGYHIE